MEEGTAQLICVLGAGCTIPDCPPHAPLGLDRACHVRCVSDADCTRDGERCCEAALEPTCSSPTTCERSMPCDEGLERDADGRCRRPCEAVEECHALGAICGADGLCRGVLAGDPFNGCEAALGAPPMDPSAPVLFDAWPVDLDPDGPSTCRSDTGCGNGRIACGLSVRAWDPEGDLPTGRVELAAAVSVHLLEGWILRPYDVEWSPGGVLRVELCVGSSRELWEGAIRLSDEEGHGSNALCLRPTSR